MNSLRFTSLAAACVFIACSSNDPGGTDDAGSGGVSADGGGEAAGTGGGQLGNTGGSAEPGSGGSVSSGGVSSGGAASGGAPGAGGEQAGSGGAVDQSCTPNAAGTFVTEGDVVLDEKTCLSWMKANTSGDPYAEAVTFCDGLELGGKDDWRMPTAGEISTIFKCDGTWPPLDEAIFTVSGDGVWTSTESGTIAGDLPKVCGAGQTSGAFYDFGQVGGQNTRCVRGTSSIADRPDCKTNTQICP